MGWIEELRAALDLAHAGREDEWAGAHLGARVGMLASSPFLIAGREGATFYVEHEVPLRCGLLALERKLVVPFPRALHGRADLALGDLELDAALRSRAVEDVVARAVLREARGALLALAPRGELAVDDQRIWLARTGRVDAATARPILDALVAGSRAIGDARSGWRSRADAAIASAWSEVAAELALAWDEDRATISGARREIAIEARVDGEPGLLYTEIFLEWPSLDLGLAIERDAERGSRGETPLREDLEAIERAFDRAHRVRARGALETRIPASAMHAGLEIGALGASLAIDDTGLVARVDRVVEDRDELGALLRSAMAIGTGLAPPLAPSGAYR